MAVTDEDLQKLGKPPIYSGKEDEWNEWSFVMKSYVSLLSTHVPALLTGAENPVVNPDMSIATIRATLTEDGVTAAKKLFHVLVDGRKRTSTGSDQRNHRHERSIGVASVDHEIRAKHSAESTESHERNPQCKDLSLRAHSVRDRTGRMAREHSQVGIDFWRPFQRVNEESSLS